MKLTKRLYAIFSMIEPSEAMADIGTDHAYIPISVIETGLASRAVAVDIHKKPAERAKENINHAHLKHQIEVRVGSGLDPLADGEVQGIVISGMGGLMIQDILSAHLQLSRHLSWLVLEPQGHERELRQWLFSESFQIVKEQLVKEEGKFYEVWLVHPSPVKLTAPASFLTGDMSLRADDPLILPFIQYKLNLLYKKIQGLSKNLNSSRNQSAWKQAQKDKEEWERAICLVKQKTL